MSSKPDDFLVQAWKQQLDFGLRAMEALVEGATRIRELQIEAAADVHADIEATRKSIAAATDASQLLKLQSEWVRANAEKCAAYWRSVYGVAAQTQAELARCVWVQPRVAAPVDDSNQALLSFIDNAYRQWLDSTQQFYRMPGMPPPATREKRAAA